MMETMLRLLCCPECRGRLVQAAAQSCDATLVCVKCGRSYPVVDGLPRLVLGGGPCADVAESFGFQWRARARGLFERGTLYGLSAEAERLNFFGALGIEPEAMAGRVVLDAGCGDGFLLTVLEQHPAQVVGIDVSASARLAADRCRDFSNVTVLQADLFSPPFLPGSFDYVWCEGVLVHTGDPRKGFQILADLVKPGGRLYVWVYSSERLSIYQRIRDFLRVAHRLPRPLVLLVSYLLAMPIAVAKQLRGRTRGADRVSTIAFTMFDNLAPRVQTRHAAAEVRAWFEESGFSDLKQTGFIGMSGTKAK